jgi:hypothetical protein
LRLGLKAILVKEEKLKLGQKKMINVFLWFNFKSKKKKSIWEL